MQPVLFFIGAITKTPARHGNVWEQCALWAFLRAFGANPDRVSVRLVSVSAGGNHPPWAELREIRVFPNVHVESKGIVIESCHSVFCVHV